MGGRGEWRGPDGRRGNPGGGRQGPPQGYRPPSRARQAGYRPPPGGVPRKARDEHRHGAPVQLRQLERPRHGSDGRPPARPPIRPRRRKRRAARFFGIFFLVILLLAVATWLYIDLSLNRTQALDDYPGRPAAGAGTNWLIVGTDSREGLDAEQQKQLSTGDVAGAGGGKRTDTMMLLHIPDNNTKPTLVSLLRDSYLDVPGVGKAKLNSAYNSGSAKLLAKTVELNTGLHIDHYIEIGFAGFASVVDDVGGVNICVKDRMVDPKAGINLKPGCQDLSGPDALGYVRTRATARADYDRVTHQRELISTLMSEVASPVTLLNPFRLFPLLADGPKLITVNESDHLQHLIGLAFAMKGASDGGLVTTTVPFAGGEVVNGQDVVLWDEARAQEMFHALNNDQAVPKSILAN